MTVHQVYYLDDGKKISGVLICRFLRRPVFYPSRPVTCGFHRQVVSRKDMKLKISVC